MLHYSGTARNMAIAIKTANDAGLEYAIASYLAEFVRPDDVLVPAPNHNGYAEYTLRVANHIRDRTGARVVDCLEVEKHSQLYVPNRQLSLKEKKSKLNMSLKMPLPKSTRYLFVDNVIDTGATFLVAKNLICQLEPLVFASTNRWKEGDTIAVNR